MPGDGATVLSIIVPVYKNEASLPELIDALSTLAHGIERRFGQRLEVVFVVDGSPDRSHAYLASALPQAPFESHLLLHARNFGSFAAIRSGLAAALGEYYGILAADLQEPPELMLEFFEALTRGDCDVVIGSRLNRDDPVLARTAANIFWRLYRAFVVPDIPPKGVDIFGCNRDFRDELLKLEESNSSLIGLLFWLGFRRKAVDYERRARRHGSSAWTLRKKLKYLFDSVFSFTDLPIRLLVYVGLLGLFTSVVLGTAVLIARVAGGISVPGYAATALIVLFFGGLNTLGLGVVGTYAWRAFENTKRRPQAVVMSRRHFPSHGCETNLELGAKDGIQLRTSARDL